LAIPQMYQRKVGNTFNVENIRVAKIHKST
jgi:hypothetical protein